jgi:hypothetical protein
MVRDSFQAAEYKLDYAGFLAGILPLMEKVFKRPV